MIRWHLGIPLNDGAESDISWEATSDADFSLAFITSITIIGSLSTETDISFDLKGVDGTLTFSPCIFQFFLYFYLYKIWVTNPVDLT